APVMGSQPLRYSCLLRSCSRADYRVKMGSSILTGVMNDLLLAGAGGFFHDFGNDRGTVPILEGGAVWSDFGVIGNGGNQVMQLVDVGMFPAQDVTVWPPDIGKGVIRLGYQHILESDDFGHWCIDQV